MTQTIVASVYTKIAIQAGFPDEVLEAIQKDKWVSEFRPATNGTKYVEQIIRCWTGELIPLGNTYDPRYPEFHRYHGHYVGQNIAECGVDVVKDEPGRYLLSTNRQNTRLVRTPFSQKEDEADADSLFFIGKHIPVSLQRYAGTVHEHFAIGELKMSLEGLCTRSLATMPGGHLDAVLHHQASHKPMPKGGPGIDRGHR